MKALFAVLAASLVLAGCSGNTVNRDSCASELNAAWHELDLAKAEGFAGTVSYSKALALISAAKTEQQVESYGGCLDKASKARFYIKESRAGR
ncbi:outer membrane murein-binding lipoprotein Lpp [Pseudomonas citronellolis]|uniref:hypothetical protein n=1 Tax=Pseudomonas citronellolis TaxID=53408 RepID=UPI00209CBE25|nr:hypothetical protein [Pseudomonas citronellolis]MCP1645768.1 outer membrane murein-binding lipoprotein Lpp [Pseudomonas citronellolis]MCP1668602.1 outer membrane murein-binding lipoprotein Lpp [Pseudomonas citronellolis]MCP1700040.1 outer membrane murein-binding lipoprotein Lpp [Pseudomonas citronellolis]MCP1706478.1 outer membrane murein-binding lipoprotein Lpp [Pseudomonas citronellolis]MCP1800268.1 outer membrane murein-binding lipoprotein Lpp [Pseudomonas citronellolis]